MTSRTGEDQDRIGGAEEPQFVPPRRDGTPHPYVTMWVARADDLYVRASCGPKYPTA